MGSSSLVRRRDRGGNGVERSRSPARESQAVG